MSLSAMTLLAAETAHEEPAVSPFLIGGVTLAILLLLLFAVVSFGGGREHS